MFDIYIKDFNQNGQLITTETLVQSIPSESQGDLKLLQPIVKCEMGNAESFNFNIEGGTKFYDAFNQMKTFMRVVYDGDTIFYGRVLTIENSFYGTRKLRLEGPLAFLNDTSIEGVKEESRPTTDTFSYMSNVINNHNSMCADARRSFTLGEVPGHYSGITSAAQQIPNNSRKYGQEGWQDSKGVIEDLRSHYGGYLRVRCPGYRSGNTFVDQGHYIDWMNHYFNQNENTQTIEVGKNVIDISTSTEIDNIFTVVIPIGNNKNQTSETVDGEKKSTGPAHFYVQGTEVTVPSICPVYGAALNSGYHTYDDYYYALEKYGRIVKTVTFDDAENASELLTKCREWIKNNYQGEVTKFTVKAIDMHQIGDTKVSKIMVGDRVKIIYPVVKEDGSIKKRTIVRTCLSISYDLYNPENNAYTFGIPANILTKSYGVTKQGKSTTQASTTPKSSSGKTSTKSTEWIDQVTEWLAHHKVNYRHKANGTSIDSNVYPSRFPYEDRYSSYMKGPYNNHRDYLYDIQTEIGLGKFLLWKFTPKGVGKDFSQDELDKILKQVEEGMPAGSSVTDINRAKNYAEKAYRDSRQYEEFDREVIELPGILSQQAIVECKIIEYVKSEYGKDLGTFNNINMPELTYKDADGVTKTVNAANGVVVTTEMFKEGYQASEEERARGFHIVMKRDGTQVVSMKDEDGNWQYWAVDPDDPTNVIPTNIRDLTVDVIDGDKAFGQLIKDNFAEVYDPVTGTTKYEPHDYVFGQAVQNWADSEMVHAWVDGDVVLIGSNATQFATVVAQNIGGTMIHPVQYCVDKETGEKAMIWVGDTGQMAYEAYWDKNAKAYRPVPYDYYHRWSAETKQAWLIANGPIVNFTGDGMWNTSNLAFLGGVATVEDPTTHKRISYLNSDLTVCGNPEDPANRLSVLTALYEAGVITEDEADHPNSQALVAKTIYTEKINGIEAHFHTIETDYLKTTYLKSAISKLDLVNVQAIASVAGYDAYCRLDSYYGNHYYFNVPGGAGSVTYKDLRYAIDYVYVTSEGATSTIHLHSIAEGEITLSNKPSYMSDDVFEQLTFKNYTGGWDAARGSVSGKTYTVNDVLYSYFPTMKPTTLLNYIKVGQPHMTVDHAMSEFTYYLTDYASLGNDYCALRYASTAGQVVASYNHGKYTAGWVAARSKITYPPANTSSNRAILYTPSVTVNGTSLQIDYYLYKSTSWNNANAYIYLYDEYHNREVARLTCGELYTNGYNSGWGAARSSVSGKTYTVSGVNYTYYYFPVSAVTSGYRQSYMKVAMPNSTVDGVKSDYTYHITSDNNDSYIRYGNASGPIVAQINHGKYNAGWNDARSRVVNNIPYSDIGEGTNSSISVLVPNTNGSSANSTYSYAMSLTSHTPPGGSAYKCIELKVNSSNVVARLDINTDWNNRYNDGYNASHSMYGTVYVSTSNIYAQVTTRELGYDSSITIYPTFTTTTGRQQRGSGITISSKPDRYNAGYNAGWDAAVDKVEYPSSAGTGSSVTFKFPKTSGSSRIGDSKQYFLHDNSDGTVVLRYQSGSNSSGAVYTNVAQVSASSGGTPTVTDITIWDGTSSYANQWSGEETISSKATVYPYCKVNGTWYYGDPVYFTPSSGTCGHTKISVPNGSKWSCSVQTFGDEKHYTLSVTILKNQSITGLSNGESYTLYK